MHVCTVAEKTRKTLTTELRYNLEYLNAESHTETYAHSPRYRSGPTARSAKPRIRGFESRSWLKKTADRLLCGSAEYASVVCHPNAENDLS